MISTTVRPALRIELGVPQMLELPRTSGSPTLVVGQTIGISPASDAPCTLFWPRSGCRPVPGRPTWPHISASEIRQRALSVPWMCCD
jgi:hypothetical protein